MISTCLYLHFNKYECNVVVVYNMEEKPSSGAVSEIGGLLA